MATQLDLRQRRELPGDGGSDGHAPPESIITGASVPKHRIGTVDIGAFEFGRDLTISPASGVYFSTQLFDIVISVPDGSLATGGEITFDSTDITSFFLSCARAGQSVSAVLTLRCPGSALAALRGLSDGVREFVVRVNYRDGSFERRSVRWELRRTTEP